MGELRVGEAIRRIYGQYAASCERVEAASAVFVNEMVNAGALARSTG